MCPLFRVTKGSNFEHLNMLLTLPRINSKTQRVTKFGKDKNHNSQRRDNSTPFSPPGNRAIFSTSGEISLQTYTVDLQKKEKIH